MFHGEVITVKTNIKSKEIRIWENLWDNNNHYSQPCDDKISLANVKRLIRCCGALEIGHHQVILQTEGVATRTSTR